MFGEFISGPPLQASIAAPSAKPLQVQLKKGSVDVATAMIKAGHALPSGDNNTQQQTRPGKNANVTDRVNKYRFLNLVLDYAL